ncbi:MAG TPA: SAF domain-containing protein [Acidimicrobiales bacterium]|nr:SAF domain-containing protein [Acidimicrobiales bacterium]
MNGRGSGQGDWKLGAAVPVGKAQRRLPEVLVGLAVVGVAALAAVLWSASATTGEDVLALRNPLAAGQVVTFEDLRTVEITRPRDVPVLASTASSEVIGRRALAPMAPGTLVVPGQFASTPPVEAGKAVVGLALSAGEYPTGRLTPGDQVAVVLTPAQGGTGSDQGIILTDGAQVYDLAPIGTQGETFVSLVVDEGQVSEVAAGASGDRIRLALVAGR